MGREGSDPPSSPAGSKVEGTPSPVKVVRSGWPEKMSHQNLPKVPFWALLGKVCQKFPNFWRKAGKVKTWIQAQEWFPPPCRTEGRLRPPSCHYRTMGAGFSENFGLTEILDWLGVPEASLVLYFDFIFGNFNMVCAICQLQQNCNLSIFFA